MKQLWSRGTDDKKLDVERRDSLFAMVVQWFANEKVVLRRLAAQLCGLFVEVERKGFDRRLETTLPLIAELLEPKQYETVVKLCSDFCTQIESQFLQQDLSDQFYESYSNVSVHGVMLCILTSVLPTPK
ncbi:Small subunit processome component 20-like [Exaiptasia diaphana]|nr:Small subunit processome component 20-like [Exaiptasia diaphana]